MNGLVNIFHFGSLPSGSTEMVRFYEWICKLFVSEWFVSDRASTWDPSDLKSNSINEATNLTFRENQTRNMQESFGF